MKIALLLGANPKKVKSGPLCALRAGKWRLVLENVKDTTLKLVSSAEQEVFESEFVLDKPTDVLVMIEKAGTENSISIYAESV